LGLSLAIPGQRIWMAFGIADQAHQGGVAAIKKAARKDKLLGAEGAVIFVEKASGALEHVDSSSGAIGTAVNRAIETLVPIVAQAPASDNLRDKWLERKLLTQRLDMVVATRSRASDDAYRWGHQYGNSLFNLILKRSFGSTFEDVFSGYRVLSRRYICSFPALSQGFEIGGNRCPPNSAAPPSHLLLQHCWIVHGRGSYLVLPGAGDLPANGGSCRGSRH
jgi:hypothetical protein